MIRRFLGSLLGFASIKRLTLRPAIELDLGWLDFWKAILCMVPRIVRPASQIWPDDRAITFLSVRTGFDCLLSTCDFLPGDEIIMSALSIRDMKTIIEIHGLVPRIIDIDPDTFEPNMESIEAQMTAKTRAIVVTQLLGQRFRLDPIAKLARRMDILVIEDCAQAFHRSYAGSNLAHISMYSFGPIKKHTALCGSRLVIQDDQIRKKMIAANEKLSRRSNLAFLSRVVKYGLLKLITSPPLFGAMDIVFGMFKLDLDKVLYRMSRGFGKTMLVDKIRKRPSYAEEKFLRYRLCQSTLNNHHSLHTPWVLTSRHPFPWVHSRNLRHYGLPISANAGSLEIIGDPKALPNASKFMSELVIANRRILNYPMSYRRFKLFTVSQHLTRLHE